MEQNKLNYSEIRKLSKIYNKLEEIDSHLFNMVDKFPNNVSNNVRCGIINTMEEIRKIINDNNNE
jgi:hypothetical protein